MEDPLNTFAGERYIESIENIGSKLDDIHHELALANELKTIEINNKMPKFEININEERKIVFEEVE